MWTAVALIAANAALVAVTMFYALQTRDTVQELRRQREATEAAEVRRRREQIASMRQGVITELEHILAIIEKRSVGGTLFPASSYPVLPTDAWRATFGSAEAFSSVEVRADLYAVYSLIDRLNGIAAIITSGGPTTGKGDTWRIGADPLTTAIPSAVNQIRSLPPARG